MKKPAKYLIVVAGPTAVGKSNLALHLAEWLATDIISADSRQIYRDLNIGTAKPSEAELQRVHHHFINELSITETFSAALFEEQGLNRLEQIFEKHRVAILCGGTGLYIQALCRGFDQIPEVDLAIRNHLDTQFIEQGLKPLQALLTKHDPEYAKIVDMSNHRRVIRALSVINSTGMPFSTFLNTNPIPRSFECINILLTEERKTLYDRINQRVDQMLELGLEQEVDGLIPYQNQQALQTVGYQEWFPYFSGEIDKGEVIRLIKRNSRRYAKRQMTWFRKSDNWESFQRNDWNLIKKHIESQIAYY